jgi:hypothetical protein
MRVFWHDDDERRVNRCGLPAPAGGFSLLRNRFVDTVSEWRDLHKVLAPAIGKFCDPFDIFCRAGGIVAVQRQ